VEQVNRLLQTKRDDLLNLKSSVKLSNFTIMRLEQRFAKDTSVYEDLEDPYVLMRSC
jgi:hypothetical protein